MLLETTGIEQGQGGEPETPVAAAELSQDIPKPPVRRVFPAGRLAYLEHCWNQGCNAREIGFARVSPYYEDFEADFYWFAGYGAMSFEAAMQIHSGSPAEVPQKHND